MEFFTTLEPWTIVLGTGAIIHAWASSYTETDDDYVFGVLVVASNEEQEHLDVTARSPSDPSRVEIALLRLPVELVASIRSS